MRESALDEFEMGRSDLCGREGANTVKQPHGSGAQVARSQDVYFRDEKGMRVRMKKTLSLAFVVAALAGTATSASAALIFSNVSVTGSVASPNAVATGANDIDFTFTSPGGVVGDPVAPIRSGNIVITFNVLSTEGAITTDIASILGATVGSGIIIFNEVIEDNVTGQILATANLTINANNPPPQSLPIQFSQPSSNFKVKKTLFLYAPDSAAPVDLAQVGLIEQRFVPAPGALALLGLGGLVATRRRRA